MTGRTELPLTVCGGARTSTSSSTLDQSALSAARGETTSQKFAQQQQYTQSYSSSSSQRQNLCNDELSARSQFDSLSVCTRRDLPCCNDDDDDGPERVQLGSGIRHPRPVA